MAIDMKRAAAPADFTTVFYTAPFQPGRVTIVNEDTTAANAIEVSFDGTTTHARLTPTVNPVFTTDRQRGTQVWIKKVAGAPNAQVIAEQ